MKKSLLFASVMLAAFSSCSNDATEMADFVPGQQQEGLVPINLGLSRFGVSVTETKGAGTVGDVAGAGNVWNKENLYVLMTSIDGSDWGYQGYDANGLESFRCSRCQPVQNGDIWGLDYMSFNSGVTKYYPQQGYSDFFAFHCDDAAGNGVQNDMSDVVEMGESEALLPFTIDGSQDLMAGKAENGDPVGGNLNRAGFSAKTARHGLIPSIAMKHLLTRLTFEIISGDDNADGLKVKAIRVDSKAQGNMVVAYNQEGTKDRSELIRWNEDAETVGLTLKEKQGDIVGANGVKTPWREMTEKVMGVKGDRKEIDGALFVASQTGQYYMYIDFEFPVKKGDQIEYVEKTEKFPLGKTTSNFEIGKSYHVAITVYGYSEMHVNATLEPWEEGTTDGLEIDCAEPKN